MRRVNSWVEPFDDWLEAQGLYRKQIARDGSCLFRAVSQQLFLTQMEHTKVRSLTLEYMSMWKEEFEPLIVSPLDHHIFNMSDIREWGGHPEIVAMSRLFKVDFLLYQEIGKPPYKATDHGFERKIIMYFNHGNHYDCILSKQNAILRGFCQSLIYETLYTHVFKLENISLAVERMLHENEYSDLRRDSANSADMKDLNTLVEKVLGTRDTSSEGDQSLSIDEKSVDIHPDDVNGRLAQGIPPFPYKVAKSLDKDIYRNIEYDAWNTIRREARFGPFDSNGFQAGVKVQVKLEFLPEELKNNFEGEFYQGHIQVMSENKGDVDIYIVELGKRVKVPYMSMVPTSPPRPSWHTNHHSLRVGGGGVGIGSIQSFKQLTGYGRKEILHPPPNWKKGQKKRENLSIVPLGQAPRHPPPSSIGRGRSRGSPKTSESLKNQTKIDNENVSNNGGDYSPCPAFICPPPMESSIVPDHTIQAMTYVPSPVAMTSTNTGVIPTSEPYYGTPYFEPMQWDQNLSEVYNADGINQGMSQYMICWYPVYGNYNDYNNYYPVNYGQQWPCNVPVMPGPGPPPTIGAEQVDSGAMNIVPHVWNAQGWPIETQPMTMVHPHTNTSPCPPPPPSHPSFEGHYQTPHFGET